MRLKVSRRSAAVCAITDWTAAMAATATIKARNAAIVFPSLSFIAVPATLYHKGFPRPARSSAGTGPRTRLARYRLQPGQKTKGEKKYEARARGRGRGLVDERLGVLGRSAVAVAGRARN